MNRATSGINASGLHSWFYKQGFEQAEFQKGRAYVSRYWQGQPVSFKLTRREGFDTYFKGAHGGSLVVFEVALQGDQVIYEGYCPIWLFGIWTLRLAFKQDAGRLFAYRKEGYLLQEKFQRFLEKHA
jgi:hypothetical protein